MGIATWRILLLAVFGVLLALAAACGGSEKPAPTPEPTPEPTATPVYLGGFQAPMVGPAIPKPDLVLTDQNGADFDLLAATEGFVTLVYIGYTNCPDVCPTHLLDIARALEGVSAEVREQVKVILITADPERDTPEVLKLYLSAFNEEFIGLTGTLEQTNEAQRMVGLRPATRTDLGGGNYSVNHAAYMMAFSTDNLAHIVFPLGVTRDVWEHDITKLVLEGWTEQ